jgi:protein gp37
MLGPVDLSEWLRVHQVDLGKGPFWTENNYEVSKLDWIVVGGESGPKARPIHPDWVRSVRDQCQAAGVPFFFKQWGEWMPTINIPRPPRGSFVLLDNESCVDSDGRIHETPDEAYFDCKAMPEAWFQITKIGKKAAGRLLDGRTWDEMPKGSGQ